MSTLRAARSLLEAAVSPTPFIVCQIGAREHYVIARELHRRGLLAALVTDAWVPPGSWADRLAALTPQRNATIKGRYAPDLKDAFVVSGSLGSILAQEVKSRLSSAGYWSKIMSDNQRFARQTVARLQKAGYLTSSGRSRPTVFAYSYAALEILAAARASGCRTLLGQIDPGPFEDELVADVARRHGLAHGGDRPPPAYWQRWREDCELADAIVVNSEWSRRALIGRGIPKERLHIAPLAFEAARPSCPPRSYPDAFSRERPLRLLFLGQVNVRKGVLELLEAMRLLEGGPVRLDVVGPVDPRIAARVEDGKQVRFAGPVPRAQATGWYDQADAMILPTHSDGFALTQLEAQAAGLPIFVSRACGTVIEEGVSGRFIDPVTPTAIAEVVRWAIDHPQALRRMSGCAPLLAATFSPVRTVDALIALGRGTK